MTTKAVSFTLTSNLCELARLQEMVEMFGEAHGLMPKTVFELNLALDELVTNIISYGYADQEEGGEIQVDLEINEGVLTVKLRDRGVAFDPLKADEPDIEAPLDERRIGGLGIHLVRKVMDEIFYEHSQGCNMLTLVKNIGQGSGD